MPSSYEATQNGGPTSNNYADLFSPNGQILITMFDFDIQFDWSLQNQANSSRSTGVNVTPYTYVNERKTQELYTTTSSSNNTNQISPGSSQNDANVTGNAYVTVGDPAGGLIIDQGATFGLSFVASNNQANITNIDSVTAKLVGRTLL